jgi:hypothetical protein
MKACGERSTSLRSTNSVLYTTDGNLWKTLRYADNMTWVGVSVNTGGVVQDDDHNARRMRARERRNMSVCEIIRYTMEVSRGVLKR